MKSKNNSRGDATNIKWGICINTNGYEKDSSFHKCSKCQNKERQAIRTTKDFICEECGEPLQECTPPKKKIPILPIIVVLGSLIAATVIFFSIKQCKTEIKNPEPQPPILPEPLPLPPTTDTTGIDTTEKTDMTNIGHKDDKEAKRPVPISHNSINLSFGILDGSLSYDNNGSIKVTKQHTFYLKDINKNVITVNPGDHLTVCRIREGKLLSFQIVRTNGERESILDVSEKLQ